MHEAKFDGWRVQIHRRPDTVKFSRKGFDLFPSLRENLEYLRESVVDGELVACDSDGRPDFAAITKNHGYASGASTYWGIVARMCVRSYLWNAARCCESC
jgi:ATP-dependent DNA ligase